MVVEYVFDSYLIFKVVIDTDYSYNFFSRFFFHNLSFVNNDNLVCNLIHLCFWNLIFFLVIFNVYDYIFFLIYRIIRQFDLPFSFFLLDFFHYSINSWNFLSSLCFENFHLFDFQCLILIQVQVSRDLSFLLIFLFNVVNCVFNCIVRVFWWFIDWNVHFVDLSFNVKCCIFFFKMVLIDCLSNFLNDFFVEVDIDLCFFLIFFFSLIFFFWIVFLEWDYFIKDVDIFCVFKDMVFLIILFFNWDTSSLSDLWIEQFLIVSWIYSLSDLFHFD